ncbi:hypothetical protein JXJ21_16765 [candidate division KSB1 bacterium]|nr:hypothetical protein [candidate division KSB1 bacterium]
MRLKAFSLLIMAIPLLSFGGTQLMFHSPDLAEPHYKICFSFDSPADTTFFESLSLNGEPFDQFIILQAGNKQDNASPLKKGETTFWLDYVWKNKTKYKVILNYKLGQTGKKKKASYSATSPEKGGLSIANPLFHRVFIVEETAGLARENELVYLTFTVPEKLLAAEKLVLFDGDTSLPFQIIDQHTSVPPEKVRHSHPITNTIKLAAQLDIEPGEKKLLLLMEGNDFRQASAGFEINGEGLGKTVKNDQLSLEFHPQSGQINIIENVKEGIKLWNEIGVIHWNPGCYIPGVAWDHSFDWNPPDTLEEISGNLLYLNSRRGLLPHIKEIFLEVKYALTRNAPYFIVETKMNLQQNLGTVALRNDEMVLYSKLFDSLVYQNQTGECVQLPLKEIPGRPFGIVHVAPDNLDWVGLLNTEKQFGFFCVRINYVNMNLDAPGDFLNQQGTYFYAPAGGKYAYWVRPLYYTWAKHLTSNHFTYAPAGSIFYEKNAYIILPLTPGYAQTLNNLLAQLRNPLWVH